MSAQNLTGTVRLLTGRQVLCAGKDRWELLDEIAGAQRNRVNTVQLAAAGFTPRMIRTALDHQQLHRVHQGVYIAGADVPVELGRETSALLVAPALVLSGLAVLTAVGVLAADPGRPVDVACLGARCASRDGVRVHRYVGIDKVTFQLGLPMTTVERALLDAADSLTGRPLELAVDEALAGRKTSRTKIRQIAEQAVGRRGREELLRLADARRPNSQTKRELAELALTLIRQAGLPEPETEVAMLGFSMDFFFREAGAVVEVDPYSIHGVIRSNFNRDRAKARACRQAGLEYISVTGDDLKDRPFAFIRDLSQMVERGTARSNVGPGPARPGPPEGSRSTA